MLVGNAPKSGTPETLGCTPNPVMTFLSLINTRLVLVKTLVVFGAPIVFSLPTSIACEHPLIVTPRVRENDRDRTMEFTSVKPPARSVATIPVSTVFARFSS
jgi:hypothetical protein